MEARDTKTLTTIRALGPRDLPDMLALEEAAWPADVRASAEQIRDRLAVFPEGCLGAYAGARLVGMATCQIVDFDPAGGPIFWSTLCADGWIRETHRPGGNCLHFVSNCVHPEVRGQGVGSALNRVRLALGARRGLANALTDTRLPGLARWLAGDPARTAEGYVEAILAREVDEPVVKMYLRLGLRPLGLIAGCMKSDIESADYGLAMIYRYPRGAVGA